MDRADDDIEYQPLAGPFKAPGGLTVDFPASLAELMALGRHFNNALEDARFARNYARGDSSSQVYRVMLDDVPVSCGEIRARGDGIEMVWDRAHRNGPGTPATGQAVQAFVDAVNAGEVEIFHDVADGRFTPRPPAPAP